MRQITIIIILSFLMVTFGGCGAKKTETAVLPPEPSEQSSVMSTATVATVDATEDWISKEVGIFKFKIPPGWTTQEEQPNEFGHQRLMINNSARFITLMFINAPKLKELPEDKLLVAMEELLNQALAALPITGAKLQKTTSNFFGVPGMSYQAVTPEPSEIKFEAVGIETDNSVIIIINMFSGVLSPEIDLIMKNFEYAGSKLRSE